MANAKSGKLLGARALITPCNKLGSFAPPDLPDGFRRGAIESGAKLYILFSSPPRTPQWASFLFRWAQARPIRNEPSAYATTTWNAFIEIIATHTNEPFAKLWTYGEGLMRVRHKCGHTTTTFRISSHQHQTANKFTIWGIGLAWGAQICNHAKKTHKRKHIYICWNWNQITLCTRRASKIEIYKQIKLCTINTTSDILIRISVRVTKLPRLGYEIALG